MLGIFGISIVLLVGSALAAPGDLSIETPAALVQCQKAKITWKAKKTPVKLSVVTGNDPDAIVLDDLGEQKGTSFDWTVDIPGGIDVAFKVVDAGNQSAISKSVLVKDSEIYSCL